MGKRCLDIVAAGSGLMVLSPLMLLIAVLIRLDDGGPIFFHQARLGRDKRLFNVHKFRSMRNGTVTRLGCWLRGTGLDELPQLVNVLRGQMSIVGPRPLTEQDVLRLGWNDPAHALRWSVRPGISGPGQIYAGRGRKLSWFMDRVYVERHGLLMDARVILVSAAMNLIGKHRVRAYLRRRRHPSMPDWRGWARRFEARAHRLLPVPQKAAPNVPASVARSLAVIQLGESGGGNAIDQVEQSRLPGINQHYRRAVRYFVAEEQRHADILALCVGQLGGRLIRDNWTAKLFVLVRRLMGVRLKILVLLAAEVIGICYYRLLASRLPDSEIRDWLKELARDEEDHLAFHCEFLRFHADAGWRRWLFRLTWRGTTYAAMAAVAFDHRRAIRDLDIPMTLLWRRWLYLIHAAERLVVEPTNDLAALPELGGQIL